MRWNLWQNGPQMLQMSLSHWVLTSLKICLSCSIRKYRFFKGLLCPMADLVCIHNCETSELFMHTLSHVKNIVSSWELGSECNFRYLSFQMYRCSENNEWSSDCLAQTWLRIVQSSLAALDEIRNPVSPCQVTQSEHWCLVPSFNHSLLSATPSSSP